MPELTTHSTLCYIQSRTSEKLPSNIKSLWAIKAQSVHNLRDRGIILDYKIDSREWINNLPDIKHVKLWNIQNCDVTFLNAKPELYNVKSNFKFLMEYYKKLDDNSKSYTGCWLCVDAELAIGQCRLWVHGTCGLINPWHHLRKMSSWVGNPGRPPYVIPCVSAGLKKNSKSI